MTMEASWLANPGVGQVEQFGGRQQVIQPQIVGFAPALFGLVAPGELDGVPIALVHLLAEIPQNPLTPSRPRRSL